MGSTNEKSSTFSYCIKDIRKIAILKNDGSIVEIILRGDVIIERDIITEDIKNSHLNSPIITHLTGVSNSIKFIFGEASLNIINPSNAVQKRMAARIKAEQKAQKARERKAARQAVKDRLCYDEELDYDIWT